MEHAKHIIRAVLLLVLAAVGFVLVRHFAYPNSFGRFGHYRFDNVAEHASKELEHGAPGVCNDCHADEAKKKAEGKHVSVSCELCHGPLSVHVKADAKVGEMPVDRSVKLCGYCHQRLDARRSDFPQVVLASHALEKGAPTAETACLECHNAHKPNE